MSEAPSEPDCPPLPAADGLSEPVSPSAELPAADGAPVSVSELAVESPAPLSEESPAPYGSLLSGAL